MKCFACFQRIAIDSSVVHFDDYSLWWLDALRSLTCYDCCLYKAPDISYVCKTLETLNLQENYIDFLPFDYFVNCTILRSVSLTSNLLEVFPNMKTLSSFITRIRIARNQLVDTQNFFQNYYTKLR